MKRYCVKIHAVLKGSDEREVRERLSQLLLSENDRVGSDLFSSDETVKMDITREFTAGPDCVKPPEEDA